MALLGDYRPRAVRGGHGLQRLGGDRAAGEPQPVLLSDQAGAMDLDRVGSDVRRDELRLSEPEPALDRVRIAARHRPVAAGGFWFSANQRRAALDSI